MKYSAPSALTLIAPCGMRDAVGRGLGWRGVAWGGVELGGEGGCCAVGWRGVVWRGIA